MHQPRLQPNQRTKGTGIAAAFLLDLFGAGRGRFGSVAI